MHWFSRHSFIFSALSPRLDDADFKTIVDNPKYKVLKHETMTQTSGMVILHPSGVAYLNDTWNLKVNKNGEKRLKNDTMRENEKVFLGNKAKEMHRLNNRIRDLVAQYYQDPKM